MITGNEIRHKVLENLPGGKGKNLQVFVAKATEKSEIEIIGKDKFMPSKQDKGSEIIVYERLAFNDASTNNYTLVELKIMQYRKSWVLFNSL
jgi:hypothetical protein